MTGPRPDPIASSYRAALLAARKRFGAIEVANAQRLQTAIEEYADRLGAQLRTLPAGGDVGAALAATELVNRRAATQLTQRITSAIAKDRDVTFHDLQAIWRDTGERVAKLHGVPLAALGAVRAPPVTMLGLLEQRGGAITWRTLVQGHTGAAASEAQAIIRQAIHVGMDPEQLARRLRAYVTGSEPLAHLFTKVPGPHGTVLKLDLRKVPPELRGAAGRMVYNSRRIAYSELANARHEANLQHFTADPLIIGVKWETAPDRGATRLPDQCDVLRDTNYFGMGPGVYPLSHVPPLPHPFDRCVLAPVTRSVDEAAQPKPSPQLQVPAMQGTTPLIGQLPIAQQQRIQQLAGQALMFAEGGGWNPHAGLQAGVAVRRMLEAHRQAVAGLAPRALPAPPVIVPSTPGPAGKAVSQALKIPKRPPVARAIELIDVVHGDGELPLIPIGSRAGGMDGQFQFIRALGKSMAIQVNPKSSAGIQMYSTIHEVGHFIDFETLGIKGRFASIAHPDLAEWRDAAEASASIKALRAARQTTTMYGRFLDYLLTTEEQWARSYAQWVALRSGDVRLTRALEQIQRDDPQFRSGLWQAEEFVPIAGAIDRLMALRGWRK